MGHVMHRTPWPLCRWFASIMSELQRSFAKAKLAGLPLEPPLPQSENNLALVEEENSDELQSFPDSGQDEDSSSASSASSTGTIRPNSKNLFARPTGFVHVLFIDFSCSLLPICWILMQLCMPLIPLVTCHPSP